MYTYWPYPTYSPYFDRFYNPYAYCPCCGRPWQNQYMITATWSDTVSYGRPYMKTATWSDNAVGSICLEQPNEQEKAEEEKSKDVKKDD